MGEGLAALAVAVEGAAGDLEALAADVQEEEERAGDGRIIFCILYLSLSDL